MLNTDKKQISFDYFLKIDVRVGTIISSSLNKKARKPAYVLEIDFGDELGIKKSSAQLTDNYKSDELVGKQICAVVNFPPMRVAGVKSEVLVLAIVCSDTGTVLIQPERAVINGEKLA